MIQHPSGALALWLAVSALAGLSPCTPVARAQGLPSFAPLNPAATSRSGLYFQPYRLPQPGGWGVAVELDYGSAVEFNQLEGAEYILDSELLRVNVAVGRDIGSRHFVLAHASAHGAYDGFMDGFFNWYHRMIGIALEERDRRPRDEFLYLVAPRGVTPFERRPGNLFLGDVRFGVGRRYSPTAQGVLSVTLPTATGPAGYGRGVVSANLLHTIRVPVSRRTLYEGSVGVGYTPSQGRLAAFQREVLVAASSGLSVRVWGRQAVYANLFYHTPYYRGTTLPALDRYDLSLDFGWLLATCGGSEWRVGLTEDLKPTGPGIDLVLRLGVALRRGTGPCAAAGTPSRPVRGD